jgi:hypothetical protein
VRDGDADALVARINRELRFLRVEHRFLEKHDIVLACTAAQEVLRALEHEIPAQMGKA